MGVLFPVDLGGLVVSQAAEAEQTAVGFRMLISDVIVPFDQLFKSGDIPEVSLQTDLGWGLISNQPADGVLLVISEEAMIPCLRFSTDAIQPLLEISGDPFPDGERRPADDGRGMFLAISSGD